jgi:hypothetical protein
MNCLARIALTLFSMTALPALQEVAPVPAAPPLQNAADALETEIREALTELKALRNAGSASAVPTARRHVRRTSGTWLRAGSAAQELHRLCVQILVEAGALDGLINELERERAEGGAAGDPPVTQVLAGLYDARNKPEAALRLYHELWQQRQTDPWLNRRVAGWFRLSKEPDRMVQALSVVWEQAPELILGEARQIGSWYAQAGRVDGVPEGIERLKSTPDSSPQWNRLTVFLQALQTGKLSAGQLEQVHAACLKAAPRALRPKFAQSLALVLSGNRKWKEASELYNREIVFPEDVGTREASESAQGRVLAQFAVESSSQAVEAASRAGRLDELAQRAPALLALSAEWQRAGEFLLAAVARRQGDEKLLIELARRIRLEAAELRSDEAARFVLQHELSECRSLPALELCLEWKRSDEPILIAAGYPLGTLRNDQARLQLKLNNRAEARRLWLSVAEAPLLNDQALFEIHSAANQLIQHEFFADGLRMLQYLLHNLLPARPPGGGTRRVREITHQTVSRLLALLKDGNVQVSPDERNRVLDVLLELLFADGSDAEPLLPVERIAASMPSRTPAEAPMNAATRPEVIPGLAAAVVQQAVVTARLPQLRNDWARHPRQDSVALLTLRAESAAAADDGAELATLIGRLRQLQQSSGTGPSFWSLRCVLHGAGDRLEQAFRFDFRGRRMNREVFDISGNSPWLVKPEETGLRVRLPANTGPIEHVGVKSRFHIHGDFEAVATYEIVQIDKPLPPKVYGGPMLMAAFADSREHANIRRERRFDDTEVYTAHHHAVSAQDQTQTVIRHQPTKAKRGQLGLLRRGSTMYWLAKDDGAAEFLLLLQNACPAQDVAALKLAIDSWGTQSVTDIRWLDLTVRAEQFVELPAEFLVRPNEVVEESVVGPPPASVRWLWWLGGFGTVAFVAVVAGFIHYRRA